VFEQVKGVPARESGPLSGFPREMTALFHARKSPVAVLGKVEDMGRKRVDGLCRQRPKRLPRGYTTVSDPADCLCLCALPWRCG